MISEQTKENIGTALLVAALTAIVAFIFIAPTVSALSVDNITISPNTTAMAGQIVTAEFNVEFTPTSLYTIDPAASAKILTDLENPQWTWQLTAESVKGPTTKAAGNPLVLNGWQFAYPLGVTEQVHITLSGKAPNITRSQTKTVFRVADYDTAGIEESGTAVPIPLLIIDPTDISYIRTEEKKRLDQLRKDIDRAPKSNRTGGIRGATSVEELYSRAAQGIIYLNTLYPEEYDRAVTRSQEIQQAINDAEDELSREAVRIQQDRAAMSINQTALLIGWFESTNNTAYPGYANISGGYKKSRDLFDASELALKGKDWADAGSNAMEAHALANQTFYKAQSLKVRANDPLTPLWDNSWIVWVALIGVIGYVLFGKRKKKGEVKK
ncbi:MAG: hypothetical protein PHP63_08685 [Candidatus Marinimicrobia bacterium]|nr:hypothetical protein [Candidatus Neomarinimicrobiota bacterium]